MGPARQGTTTPTDSSRQLPRRLDVAAKRSRTRRVHARYDRSCRPAMRWRAWHEVRGHGGAAGAAGVTIAAVERHGAEPLVEPSRPDRRAGTDRPPPVLRGYRPQPDGGPRPVGMPTGRDRVGQQACKRVIAPIFAANCPHPSDGCRPQRRAHHAGNAVQHARSQGWWVVEAEIPRDCDPIAHTRLVRLVARRMRDRRVLKRIRPWRQAGVVEQGHWPPPAVGSPHGGVIRPVRAHRYVHVLALSWVPRDAGLGALCRYAADLVIVCRTPHQAAPA